MESRYLPIKSTAILLFALVNLLDLLTTYWSMSLGEQEFNPLVTTVLENFGYMGWALIKVLVVLVFIYFINRNNKTIDRSLYLVTIFYYIIVLSNITVLYKYTL